ncbi:MAG: GNAT family N-acetyltransferase [Ilumatobacteraceae bacterium]
MSIGVRAARLGDEDALGAVHVAAWQAAYRGIMPSAYLDGLDPAERAAMWARFFEAQGADQELRVVAVDGVVVGFACFGRCRDEGAEADAELYAINLHPDHWGRGLGRRLLADVTDRLTAHGSSAVLWVVPENLRARSLYESAGWADDDARRQEDVLGAQVVEMRYCHPLGGPPKGRAWPGRGSDS